MALMPQPIMPGIFGYYSCYAESVALMLFISMVPYLYQKKMDLPLYLVSVVHKNWAKEPSRSR